MYNENLNKREVNLFMSNEKIGQFISELRKSKQMTQKDLADKLNITDKAVSKWERGLNCPDISLLSSISDILGVTTSELLNGKKSSDSFVRAEANIDDTEKNIDNKEESIDNIEKNIDNALQYAEKNTKRRLKSLQDIFAISFSVTLLLGIIVCAICDMAISGTFTWSLFPISSSVFAWIIFFPVIKFNKKGILCSMAALSVLIIPFLYVLNNLIKTNSMILPIGIRMAVIGIAFIWCIFVIFKIFKTRKLLAAAISILLVIPVQVLINFVLSKIIAEPIIDIWDTLNFSIIAIAVAALLVRDFYIRKK